MAVCRRWRDLIVGTQALWCTINLQKNLEWIRLCLARSGAIPVNLLAQAQNLYPHNRVLVVCAHVDRIRSLIFNKPWYRSGYADPGLLIGLQLLFSSRMPMLEKLNFSATRDMQGCMYHFPSDTELTSKRFPSLRSLTLAGVVAPQDPSLYTHLRSLSLKNCSHTLPFDCFLDALDSCTRLKDLHLEDTLHHLSGDWMDGDSSPRRPLVSFPHLDSLVLLVHSAICTSRFLAHLHIHPYTRLTILANTQDGEDGAHSMATMLPENPAVTLEPLATAHALEMFMSLGANKPKISTYTGPGVLPDVHLRMELRPQGPLNHYASPRWGSIVEVHPDTVASWATVFRTFHLLDRLSISGGWGSMCAVGIKNAFLRLHAASTADPDSPIACPNLAHVSVHAGVEITAVYQAMRTCFRFRGDRRVVLAELELDFDIPKSSTALYRACVKDIVDCVERLSLQGVPLGRERGI